MRVMIITGGAILKRNKDTGRCRMLQGSLGVGLIGGVLIKVLIVIAVVIGVLSGVAYMFNLIPWPLAASTPPSSPPQDIIETDPNPAPTFISTPIPSLSPSPSTTNNITFDFVITNISGSGFSRTIIAQLTNRGSTAAHNVWAKIEASSGESKVKLSGQDYLREDIGTLKAGEIIGKQVTLNFAITDGVKIMQKGVHLELTILSDEYTQTFSYDYTP